MDTQLAYEVMREYFSREGAVLAKFNDEGVGAGTCAYRTPDGHACAIGCLIPPALYDERMEGFNNIAAVEQIGGSIATVFEYWPRVRAFFDGVDHRFLREAQGKHDVYAVDAPGFVRALDDIARRHGLEVVSS